MDLESEQPDVGLDPSDSKGNSRDETSESLLQEFPYRNEVHEPPISFLIYGKSKRTELGSDLECTGLHQWFGAENLSDYLCSRSQSLLGFHILEFGCGLGMAGICASKLVGFNGSVFLTDMDHEVLNLCQDNVTSNAHILDAPCFTHRFEFGDITEENEILARNNGNKFDLLIAADVLYESSGWQIKILFESASRLLSRKGEFILAYTRRLLPEDLIYDTAKQCGFDIEVDPNGSYDIFGNNTDGLTDMWTNCIYIISHSMGMTSS